MSKRRSREDIRTEFVKLAKVFVFLSEQRIEEARENGDQKWLETLEQTRATEESLQADFDARRPWSYPHLPPRPDGPKWTASMHLSGLREGLNDTLIGVQEAISDAPRTGPNRWARMPETYHALTGGDLFLDAGDPIGRIKAILKRNSIVDEEEWRMLNEVVSDVDTNVLSEPQICKANRLLAEFEERG